MIEFFYTLFLCIATWYVISLVVFTVAFFASFVWFLVVQLVQISRE